MGLVIERLPATLQLAGLAHCHQCRDWRCPLGSSQQCGRIRSLIPSGKIFALLGQSLPSILARHRADVDFRRDAGLAPDLGTVAVSHMILPGDLSGMVQVATMMRLIRSSHAGRAGQ